MVTITIAVEEPAGSGSVSLKLSTEKFSQFADFLSRLQYGDFYRHVPHWGDGNGRSSQSHQEVCVIRDCAAVLVLGMKHLPLPNPGHLAMIEEAQRR
jgi:hypothetical protein